MLLAGLCCHDVTAVINTLHSVSNNNPFLPHIAFKKQFATTMKKLNNTGPVVEQWTLTVMNLTMWLTGLGPGCGMWKSLNVGIEMTYDAISRAL